MRGRLAAVAVLAGASLATSAWADECAANIRRVDTFGRLKFGARVSAMPAWARPATGCGPAAKFCESFVDPEGVVYSLAGEGYVLDKRLKAGAGASLPWGLKRDDTKADVERKLARLLPGAEIGLREDRKTPTYNVYVPACEFEWIEVEVGPDGVNWVSINAQP